MKKIGLLGSTGSVGVQTLNIIREMPNQFSVKYLSANNNVKLLVKQSKEFKPDMICIVNESHVEQAKQELKQYNIEILHGISGLNEISKFNNIDLALNAIVGSAGMRSTYNIVSSNIDLALANKESLVMAGKLIMDKVNKSKSNIFPVDSEHSAIWQCLKGEREDDINKMILTASGGPFLNISKSNLPFSMNLSLFDSGFTSKILPFSSLQKTHLSLHLFDNSKSITTGVFPLFFNLKRYE